MGFRPPVPPPGYDPECEYVCVWCYENALCGVALLYKISLPCNSGQYCLELPKYTVRLIRLHYMHTQFYTCGMCQ